MLPTAPETLPADRVLRGVLLDSDPLGAGRYLPEADPILQQFNV